MAQTPRSHEPKQHEPQGPDEKGGRKEQSRGLDDLKSPGAEERQDILDYLRTFEFEPRKEERAILDRIESHIGQHVGILFEESDKIVDEYYHFVRARKTISEEEVQYIDDYSRLTGQDVESFIGRLQHVIYNLSNEVSKLHMQAQLSYSVWDDEYWQSYRNAPSGGTINDNIAHARSLTKQSRYIYFFTYYYYKMANDKLEQVSKMRQVIEFTAQRVMRRER